VAKNAVRVTIGGMDLLLRTPKDPERTRFLAAELDKSIAALTKNNANVTVLQAAILSGLGALDDAAEAQAQCDELRGKVRACLTELAALRQENEGLKEGCRQLKEEMEKFGL